MKFLGFIVEVVIFLFSAILLGRVAGKKYQPVRNVNRRVNDDNYWRNRWSN